MTEPVMLRTAKRRAEREAMDLAVRWIQADPFYEPKTLTEREKALMQLVLRCYTQPELSARGILRLLEA